MIVCPPPRLGLVAYSPTQGRRTCGTLSPQPVWFIRFVERSSQDLARWSWTGGRRNVRRSTPGGTRGVGWPLKIGMALQDSACRAALAAPANRRDCLLRLVQISKITYLRNHQFPLLKGRTPATLYRRQGCPTVAIYSDPKIEPLAIVSTLPPTYDTHCP